MKSFIQGDVTIKQVQLKNLPLKVQIYSYCMVFVPILCIPGYAIYKLIITPGRDFDEVKSKRNIVDHQSVVCVFFCLSSVFNVP